MFVITHQLIPEQHLIGLLHHLLRDNSPTAKSYRKVKWIQKTKFTR